ncbi:MULTISPECIES: DUF1482 family protein [Enterobacteriaceae]|uniref:DUF1482 family protein n=1 Tax=Enterobacteriaceae TaxID=543 RepID=UPI00061E4854|nr:MULTISPECIES: DUF1482 family protein [Enterobacteriaceae]ELC7256232.1 DUF1482 family protein [Enterobacter hormaechei]ELZ5061445.1 DUF1482 family protein [Enterobacter hormaechei]KJO79959.1 hypothetical protein SR86_23045 [Enterobacter hormaechei subsp. xiangfangensis]MBK3089303.1 DUF1482 family protein [Enterobacter hormaechei]MBK4570487.1 DUF1482 family protein [Enterobacter hormaechei]
MSSFFALIVTVCALTGECSDIMLGIYQTESGCDAAAKKQLVRGECYPYRPAADRQPAFKF